MGKAACICPHFKYPLYMKQLQEDREQKRPDSQLIYAAVILEVARGLLLIYVHLKKAGPLSVLHVAQLKHTGGSLGCILQSSRMGVKKTQIIRGRKKYIHSHHLAPRVHTFMETLHGCTTPFLEGGGLRHPEHQRVKLI